MKQTSRVRRATRLIVTLSAYRRRDFLTAVGGSAIFATCTVASSWILRWLIDHVIVRRFETDRIDAVGLVTGIGLFVGVAVLRAAGVVVRRTWAGKAEWGVAQDLSSEVIRSVVAQPVPWHRRQNTGDLITRVGVDVEAAVSVLAPLPYASGVVLMMCVAGIGLVTTDAVLGLLATAVFPVFIVLNVLYQRRADRWYDLAQDELGILSAAAHESFEAVTVVKSFGAEEREASRLAEIAFRVRSARLEAIRLRSLFETLLDLVPNATNIVIVLIGARRIEVGAMSVGELVSFVYVFTLLVFPLRLIGYALSELPRSQAGYERIRSVLDEPVVPDPRSEVAESDRTELVGATVRHVADRVALDSVSCRFPTGALTSVVGHTGAGKTTLLHALAGLVAVESGTVRGPTSVSLVFQEPFLVSGTIRENLTLGRSIADDRLVDALDTVAGGFVLDLPGGLDSTVGERGAGLSGGQRQRIALARAILDHPRLLLLDDVTSALDPSTEATVVANLRRDLRDTTIVAVASRPSLVAVSEHVVVLESGRVVGEGRHDDLMASQESYRELMSAYESSRT